MLRIILEGLLSMAVRKLKLTRLFWQWDIVPGIPLRNFWRERLPWSQSRLLSVCAWSIRSQ